MIAKGDKTYLFSDAGRQALLGFVDRTTLFAFDLDGTLAPIVADPAMIEISEQVRQGLVRLGRLAPVAVVTGRACTDSREHLGFEPRFLVGNHGAEGLPGRAAAEKEYARLCRVWAEQLQSLLPEGMRDGIIFEDKGASLSLHYRHAPDREATHRAILVAVGRLQPSPRRISGKQVENLTVPDAPHKGEALKIIMGYLGCRRALFVGDDLTDEDVFRMGNGEIFGIRVGLSSDSAARFFVRDQDEVADLLDMVATELERSNGS
jgi:trehalose 6-phosphate phosphatase